MQLLFLIVSTALLILVIYQDFKYRAIDWWLLPLFFLIVAVDGSMRLGIPQFFQHIAINSSIVLVQLAALWGYFILKNKKIVNIIDTQLGLGDVLFFFVLTGAFEPLNFILAYSISLLLVLAGWVVFKLITSEHNPTSIPLAGGMSIVLAAIMIVSFVFPEVNRYQSYLLW